ncbi:MAG: hypothetical protein Q9169_007406 [Polycauliona sp. 2 TL-2023]
MLRDRSVDRAFPASLKSSKLLRQPNRNTPPTRELSARPETLPGTPASHIEVIGMHNDTREHTKHGNLPIGSMHRSALQARPVHILAQCPPVRNGSHALEHPAM